MPITKGKWIAASALAALGGVAAIAVAGQPDSGDKTKVAPAASAERAKLKPRVKREVVRRTKHVQDKGGTAVSAGAAVPAASSSVSAAPAANVGAGATQVSAPVPPAETRGSSEGKSSEDDHFDDEGAYEDDDHGEVEDEHEEAHGDDD